MKKFFELRKVQGDQMQKFSQHKKRKGAINAAMNFFSKLKKDEEIPVVVIRKFEQNKPLTFERIELTIKETSLDELKKSGVTHVGP